MIYAKAAALLLACLLLFGSGWYFRGLKATAALEADHAAQAENTAKAVLAERAAGQAELTRVNSILEGYENEALKPVDPRIAVRVLDRACPAVRAVPSASANPASPGSAGPQPGGDPGVAGLLQRLIDAAQADANELTALQQAWPR